MPRNSDIDIMGGLKIQSTSYLLYILRDIVISVLDRFEFDRHHVGHYPGQLPLTGIHLQLFTKCIPLRVLVAVYLE